MLGSHFHRQVLAAWIYLIDTVALITAFIVVKQNPTLTGISVGIIVAGFLFFGFLSYMGQRLMNTIDDDDNKEPTSEASSLV